jgi:hypothetical protein
MRLYIVLARTKKPPRHRLACLGGFFKGETISRLFAKLP